MFSVIQSFTKAPLQTDIESPGVTVALVQKTRTADIGYCVRQWSVGLACFCPARHRSRSILAIPTDLPGRQTRRGQHSQSRVCNTPISPNSVDHLLIARSIFAVHGLNPRSKSDSDHAWDTWRTPPGPGGRLWLSGDLPSDIPDARIFLYEYNSTVVYGRDRDTFVGKANEMLEAIRVERDDVEGRPILLLGHSLGGLLIKQALINAHNNPHYTAIKNATRGLAFFATPHNGGDWKLLSLGTVAAKIALATGFQQGDDVLETLKHGSIFSDLMDELFRQQLMEYNIISFWGAFDDVSRISTDLGLTVLTVLTVACRWYRARALGWGCRATVRTL